MIQSPSDPPGREEVVAILAKLGDRTPDEVTEPIGSLELAWLISEVEQRYGVTLELNDEVMERMLTVSDAVTTLGSLFTADQLRTRQSGQDRSRSDPG
jgi:acyl carrier protein